MRVSNLMYGIYNNNMPQNTLKLFGKTSLRRYNTRSSSSGKVYVQNTRLEIQKRPFSQFGVRLWNGDSEI